MGEFHDQFRDNELHPPAYISDTDPATTYGTDTDPPAGDTPGVQAGQLWIEHAASQPDTIQNLKVRNAANDGWVTVTTVVSTSIPSVVEGDLLIADGADSLIALNIGSEHDVLVSGSARPEWKTGLTPDNLDLTMSPSWTGTHDFSGAGLILPGETSPTPGTEGLVAWDTDDDKLRVSTGAALKTLVDEDRTLSGGTGIASIGNLSQNRTISLEHLGLENLTDPGADRLLFWDDSESATGWLTLGTGLSISTTTLAVSELTDSEIAAGAEIAVAKLADGTARQLLQTDAAGTGVEWASNIDIPGTLDVTGAVTFDSAITVQGQKIHNPETNTLVGGTDLANLTTGANGTAWGVGAADSVTEGNNWTAVGYNAGSSSTTGDSWTAVGYNAGSSSTTGNSWTAVGYNAGASNTTSNSWTAVGYNAGASNTTGNSWTAVGVNAGSSSTTGSSWTAVGYNAGSSSTTGNSWTAVGYNAGASNTTGSSWTAVGRRAGFSNTTSNSWTAVGYNAGASNTTGDSWTAVGRRAGFSNTTGNDWTAVGYDAARYIANGTDPAETNTTFVAIGVGTKLSADGTSNEIVIGYNAIGQGSNTAVLGNTSVTDAYLPTTLNLYDGSSYSVNLYASAANTLKTDDTLEVGTAINGTFPNSAAGTGLIVETNDGSTQEIKRDSSTLRAKSSVREIELTEAQRFLDVDAISYEIGGYRDAGFGAEHVEEAGLTDVLAYDTEGTVQGFKSFGRGLMAYHHVLIQDHAARLDSIATREERLEEALRKIVEQNPDLPGAGQARALLHA